MHYKKLFVCLPLLLAACTSSSQDTTRSALDTVSDETSASWNKARDYFDLGHAKQEKKGNAGTRYCYRTMQDVICYPAPIAGQEDRLTGWQESDGKAGYIMPAHRHMPPPIDATATLPPLKSVAVNAPPKVLGTSDAAPKKQLKEVIFDPAELEPKQLVPDKEQ